MSLTAVSRCLQCHAVVNVHWPACLVCRAVLPMVPADPPAVSTGDTQATEPVRIPPLSPGWLVVYRDQRGTLRGGVDEREHGTVKECQWQGTGWFVVLISGESLPLSIIRAVGQTNGEGRLVAAWTVREHGLNGLGN